MFKILVVCTGNICRSPTAEAIMRHLIKADEVLKDKVYVASCGISDWHVGDSPDFRAIEVGEQRGVSFSGLESSVIEEQDFYDYDLMLAMDKSHFSRLKKIAPKDVKADIRLFLEYADYEGTSEVIDPYYGDAEKFEYVFDLLSEASENALEKLREQIL